MMYMSCAIVTVGVYNIRITHVFGMILSLNNLSPLTTIIMSDCEKKLQQFILEKSENLLIHD